MTIRTKLVASVALAIVAMVVAGALASQRATSVSIERTAALISSEQRSVDAAVAAAVAELPPRASLDDVAAACRPLGRWVLIAAEARVVGASMPSLLEAEARREESGALLIAFETRGPQGDDEEELLLPLSALVVDVDGVGRAELYVLPAPRVVPEVAARELVESTTAWIVATVLAVGLVALASVIFWTRRLLRPIESLTAAVTALEAGDVGVAAEQHTGAAEIDALGRAFNDMVATRDATESLRTKLVSDVAHELRSPLTNLRCQVDAVHDGVRPPGEALAIVDEQLGDLERVVEDLESLARADAGMLELDIQAVDVANTVASLLAAMTLRSRVNVEIEPGVAVVADAVRLRQVLVNLVSNADAYAEGVITISATVDADVVVLSVGDDGPGIPPEHRERVFERFHRVDPSRTRTTGGSGLGLAIVRRLVTAQHADVHVESSSVGGALIVLRWPRAN